MILVKIYNFNFVKNTENTSFRHINANIHNQALNDLESLLNRYGKCLKNFSNMPIPTVLSNYKQDNNLIREEQNYDIEEMTQIFENGFSRLNTDQQAIFKKVVIAVENQISTVIFVDGPGGMGKTFLYT